MLTELSPNQLATDKASTQVDLLPLDSLLSDHFKWHSDYQIDHFILGNCSTTYGAYKQALRGLHARVKSLRFELLEYQSKLLDLEDVFEADNRRHEIEREKIKLEISQMEWALTHRRRELRRFWSHATRLKNILGDLTPDRRAELERGHWIEHIQKLLVIDMFQNNRPSKSTIEILSAIPEGDRVDVMSIMKDGMNVEAMARFMNEKGRSLSRLLPDSFADDCKRIESSLTDEDIDKRVANVCASP